MEEWDKLVGGGISRLCMVVFVIVAALAEQREVIRHGAPTAAPRRDVVQRESLRGESGLAVTVFAPPTCPPLDDFT
jgi:hypothetical protein